MAFNSFFGVLKLTFFLVIFTRIYVPTDFVRFSIAILIFAQLFFRAAISFYKSKYYIVAGSQGGDEGKGKVVDYLISSQHLTGFKKSIYNVVEKCFSFFAPSLFTNGVGPFLEKIFGVKIVIGVSVNGGSNAGHTIYVDGKRFAVNFFSSGVISHVHTFYGSSKVLEPNSLRREYDLLLASDIKLENVLKNKTCISERIHLTTLGLLFVESAKKSSSNGQPTNISQMIGTTNKGIGPTYGAKHSRFGIRLIDMKRVFDKYQNDPTMLDNEIIKLLHNQYNLLGLDNYSDEYAFDYAHNAIYGSEPITVGITKKELYECKFDLENIKWFFTTFYKSIFPAGYFKNYMMKTFGYVFVFEMSNAFLLDITHGTYRNVTSSDCTPTAICQSFGISIQDIKNMDVEVIGVVKAYPTRVGKGPFVTMIPDSGNEEFRANPSMGIMTDINDKFFNIVSNQCTGIASAIISKNKEFGVTTGRMRRPGWLDLMQLKHAHSVSGYTALNITRGDGLNHLDHVYVCIGYIFHDGTSLFVSDKDFYDYPSDDILSEAIPIYIKMEGWKGFDFTHAASYSDLHPNFQAYIELIEKVTGIPVKYINTGADRDNILIK